MVALDFDAPGRRFVHNLNEVPSSAAGAHDEPSDSGRPDVPVAMGLAEGLPRLAEASRTVGSPQIRNRGTIGGNLGTASPAGDALPPLLDRGRRGRVASVRGVARDPHRGVPRRRQAERARADELIVAVRLDPSGQPQTFMKIGPRNAMVIAVTSLALVADRERGELRAAFGSAAPTPRLVRRRSTRRTRSPSRSPRRRARSTTCAAPPRYRRHASASSRSARSRGASREDRADRQRRASRGGRLGGREPPRRRCATGSAARLEERVRAGRVRLVLRPPRRRARLLVPRARGPGRRARGRTVEGSPTEDRLHPVRRRSPRRERSSAASARPASSSPPPIS
jgi:hypothetical protein